MFCVFAMQIRVVNYTCFMAYLERLPYVFYKICYLFFPFFYKKLNK